MPTQGDMKRRLRHLLNDPEGVFWSETELEDYLHEGQEVLAEETLALKQTFLIPRRTGTYIYDLAGLSAKMMAPYRIWLPDLHRRLECVSLTSLDQRQADWQGVPGDPWVWAPIDWRQFAIWPVAAMGQGMMEVNCYVWPDRMADDSDSPAWFPASDEALVLYGEHLGYMKQWEPAAMQGRFAAFDTRDKRVQAQANDRQMQGAYFARNRKR